MESYEKEWLADQPILLSILHCVGLFDRPASGDCLEALRAKPAIRGLTDALVGLRDEQWRRAVARLREVRLLAPLDPSDPEALDAHPLVREWFGERARLTNEAAWKAAHSRLYDHLRRSTREGSAPTLADFAPLYHAIVHGCRAGRFQEAFEKVYRQRLCRWRPDGEPEFYSNMKLGALGSDLAAISWFFEGNYETPSAALTLHARAGVVDVAGAGLRAQGRLQEALLAMRAAVRLAEEEQNWVNAALAASNLSQTELLVGEIAVAKGAARKAVAHADRSGDVVRKLTLRASEAEILHAAGEPEKAQQLLAEAERMQGVLQPGFPWLYSVGGHCYCELLLSQGQPAAARDRTMKALEVSRGNNWIFVIALDNAILGRAHHALALLASTSDPLAASVNANARAAALRLIEAVEGLRASGRNDHLPRGVIARAAFRRAIGDWDGAKRDLDEAKEIAEPGLMRLYWCDCALESARLALARREAFAPLNGLVEPSPPRPVLPDAMAAVALREEARNQLDVARGLIGECGYHRRDEELAELDTVVAGARRFGDLPPRV
jgi:tetratricopeptide (TPR) repeat protein